MTIKFTRYLLTTMVVPIILAIAASPALAETNQYYEACKALGGKYEERRTDCEPECKTTYICYFKEGGSRVCDDQGVCKVYEEGSSGNTSTSSESSSQNESDSGDDGSVASFDSFEDCVDEARYDCRDQCDDEIGFDAIDCKRSCLEGLEGQCEEYDYESEEYDSGSDEDCDDCLELCEDACDILLQSRRRDNCRSECKSRCDNECS